MALSFSNLVSPLGSALSSKTSTGSSLSSYLNGFTTLGSSRASSLVGTPASASKTTALIPPKAATTASTAALPKATTQPLATKVTGTSSTGSYKGVAITPGSDADVSAQIARIDSGSSGSSGGSSGLVQLPYIAPSTVSNPSTSPTYGSLVQQLADNAKAAAEAGKMSEDEQTTRQRQADLASGKANALANIGTHGWDAAFQAGQEGIVNRNTAAQQAVLEDRIQSYVAERNAALQGLQTSGSQLQQAASLAAPSVTGYGQTSFNPLSNSFGTSGGSSIAPNDPIYPALQQYAQLLAKGQISAIPSFITGNPVLNAQVLQMAQQINPSFNYNTAVGTSGAEQHNASVSGTATTDAYNSIYQTALHDYTNLQQSVQNVDQFGTLLTSNMTAGGINSTDVKYANQTLGQIRSQLSSGAQAQYDTTLAALRSKISGMLSVGGNETPSAITADAQRILDGTLPLGALSSVLQRIQTEGNILLQNQAQKVNNAKSGTQGGSGATGGNTSDPLGILYG